MSAIAEDYTGESMLIMAVYFACGGNVKGRMAYVMDFFRAHSDELSTPVLLICLERIAKQMELGYEAAGEKETADVLNDTGAVIVQELRRRDVQPTEIQDFSHGFFQNVPKTRLDGFSVVQ